MDEQAVASILHGSDVDVSIIKRKGEDDSDHVQFSITERKKKKPRIRKSESVDMDAQRSPVLSPRVTCPHSGEGMSRNTGPDSWSPDPNQEHGTDEDEDEDGDLFGSHDRTASDSISFLLYSLASVVYVTAARTHRKTARDRTEDGRKIEKNDCCVFRFRFLFCGFFASISPFMCYLISEHTLSSLLPQASF